MGKFLNNISNSTSTLKSRAEQVNTLAHNAYSQRLSNLKTSKTKLEMELKDLEDMSPSNTTSLKPAVAADYNFDDWAETHINKTLEIEIINQKIEIAEKAIKDLFED